MSLVTPKTMPGTLELLPREQIAWQRMVDQIRSSYERFGFLPIETPVMEFVNVLLTKSGGETEKQVYFAQSTGARQQGREPELALRFDLTVPLARYVAQHEHDLIFPFRRYQMQKVYRGESAQRGRYREFLQCDIDVVDRDELSLEFDAEIPVVIHHLFRKLNVGSFTIQLNNRRILRGFCEHLGIADNDRITRIFRELDKIDKRGREAVAETLSAEEMGLGADGVARLLDFLQIRGTHDEVLRALRDQPVDHPLYRQGVAELTTVVEGMADRHMPEEAAAINLSIARGLDYYTGTVYETVLDDHPELGSVCSGGRYEDLAGLYTKTRLPGVGISLGATRLFYQLQKLNLLPTSRSSVQVLVTRFSADLLRESRQLASELREAGLNAILYHADAKLGKQMKYADRSGIRWAVILGEDEQARGVVMAKDLVEGKQVEVPRAGLAAHLLAAVREES